MKFAKGRKAWGLCARSGRRMLLKNMVEDGETHLLVDPAWRDTYHPQKKIVNLEEGIALKRPAPNNEDDSIGNSGQTLVEALGFDIYFGGDRELTPIVIGILLESGAGLLLEDGTALLPE